MSFAAFGSTGGLEGWGTAAATNITIPVAARVDGEIILLHCYGINSAGTNFVAPAEWTPLVQHVEAGNSFALFWAEYDSSMGTNVSIDPDAGTGNYCFVSHWTGCQGDGNPFDVVEFSNGDSTTPTFPDATTTESDALIARIVAGNWDGGGAHFSNWSGSLTEHYDDGHAGATGGAHGVASEQQASIGATGTRTVDGPGTAKKWVAVTLAILSPTSAPASGLTLAGSPPTDSPTAETGALRLTPFSLAGLKLWLDADQITGLVDADPVTTWEDQSGRGNDVTGTGTTRPTYQTGELNSLPVVRFDGSDDVLERADALGLTGNPDLTIFVVGKANNTGEDASFILLGDSAGAAGQVIEALAKAGTPNYPRIGFNNGNEEYNTADVGSHAVMVFERPSGGTYADSKFYLNGSEVAASSSGNPTFTPNIQNELTLIGSTVFSGTRFEKPQDIAEILVFNAVLSSGDRQAVEDYLLEKWGFVAPLFLSGDVAVVSPAALLGTLSIGSTVLLAGSVADASLEALLGTLDLGAGLLLAGSTATVNVQALLGTLITEAILLLGASPTVTPEALTGAIVIGESIYLLGSTADSSMEALLGEVVINRVPGIYYYNGTNWVLISS